VRYVLPLLEIALDKPLHLRRPIVHAQRIAEDLQIRALPRMVGIGIQFALCRRRRLHRLLVAVRVRIGLVAVQSVQRRPILLEIAQHVVERPVLHHQHNDMFELVQSRWHAALRNRKDQ
jgi:hypothetical protein